MIEQKRPNIKLNSIVNKTKLIMKLFPKEEKLTLKDYFNEKLEKLFNSAPSNLGYKSDIESLLSDLGINKQHLLDMVISCLSKSVRNKKEVKIIASYLFFMQDFLKLIKAKGVSEKETILLKDLITLSEAMIYEKQQKNTIMMRYGDKGSTAYIILKGQVDILIESSYIKNLGEKSYLYYLANLIKYHEFGLVNLTVNDNFKKYPIEIIDDITTKSHNDNIRKKEIKINFKKDSKKNEKSDINIMKDKNKNNINININKEINQNNIFNSISNNNINNIINNNPNNKININQNIVNINNQNFININQNTIINQNDSNKNFKINNSSSIRSLTLKKSIKIQKLELLKMNNNNENQNPLSSRRKIDTKRDNQQKGFFKLNFINEELKDIKKVKKYRAKELLEMFGLKILDKKSNKRLNHCSIDEYIQRLNIFEYLERKEKEIELKKKLEEDKKKNIEYKKINKNIDDKKTNKIINDKKNNKNISDKKSNKNDNKNENINNNKDKKESINSKDINKNEINKNKEKNNNENNNNYNYESEEDDKINKSSSSLSSIMHGMNTDIIFDLKLYSYKKVVTLGIGSLFGEMALNDANSLRKATIITSSDCHFSVLNKKTFNNCIRMGAQKHLRELLQFFIELPIFSGIPEGVFYHKYYTNLSKISIIKGKKVINQGDKPENIILLQTGLYGLYTRMSLYEITRLIFRYAKFFNNNNELSKDKKDKNININNININNNEIKNKYKLLIQNVINIMNEENLLINDNMIFKKFYNTQQYIRVADISCPEVIINDEYLDENGLFAFSIESKAPENIIYTLSNTFYFDLINKNISVKKNQDKLMSEKMNLMIERLLIIRNSLINSFFDYKSRNEVGVSVIKELEEMIFKQLKKKRSLIKKDEKIINVNENIKTENKDKKYLSNENIYYKYFNQHLFKNKNKEKYYLDTNSLLYNNYSYLKNKKRNNTLKLYQEFEKNMKNTSKKNINRKINSFKIKNKYIKFSNKFLNLHKKELSLSPEKKLNITYKEFNSINKLPYKDNEDDILFSLFDENNNIDECDSNDINKMTYTNFTLSRNKKNQFTQMKKDTILNLYKSEEQKNNSIRPLSREVLMNDLIWEKMKSVIKFPITQNVNKNNFNKTFSNFHKNKKMNNNNLRSYLENNLKTIDNRNKNKIEKKSKTVDNKSKKNDLLSHEFSFNSNKFENINNILTVSSFSNYKNSLLSMNKVNNTEVIIKEGFHPPILNLKKLYKSIDSSSNNIRLKKYYSPHEINFMRMSRKMRYIMDGNKYNKIKGDNFKINRAHYYKKNLVSRMNYFYGNAPN